MKESQSAQNSQLFASPNHTTKEITFGEREYVEVAESLCEALQGKNFFSDHTITEHEGFYSLLTTTLIIYRTEPNDPESPVRGIVPVWWEMKTYLEDPLRSPHTECLNDFSLRELLRHICPEK